MPDLTEVQLNKLNLELRMSRKKSLTVTDSRIFGRRSPVGARGRGSGGPFYGAQPRQPTQTRAPTGERLQKFLYPDSLAVTLYCFATIPKSWFGKENAS